MSRLRVGHGGETAAGALPRPLMKRGREAEILVGERPAKFQAVDGHIRERLLGGPQEFGGIAASRRAAAPVDLFGGGGREAYMQRHVHRKLHSQAALMPDEELLELGRLSFNDQFGVFEARGGQAAEQELGGQGQHADIFGGASRDAYMMQHVHRRLHSKAAVLSDEELLALGKLNFNDQFPMLGADGDSAATTPHAVTPRAHAPTPWLHTVPPRQLSAAPQAAALRPHVVATPQALTPRPHSATPRSHAAATRAPAVDLFLGLGREGYLAQRVHRRLHAQANALDDQELYELGQMSFNQQFTYLESMPVTVAVQKKSADRFQAFGGREGYMQQRVHRRLHIKAATLSDKDLLEVGQLSFNDQFPVLEHIDEAQCVVVPAAQGQGVAANLLGGMSREAYMAARVHRRLHPQAAQLDDDQLHELGQLSFNHQFPFLEAWPPPRAPTPDLFPGQGRDGYMQQRVHRRLHPKAALLSDEGLLELGRLSFNEQFPALEHVEPDLAPAPEQVSVDPFGGLDREAYMAQRVHRKLHAQAGGLSDEQLADLGRLSFNQQFPHLESLEDAAEAEDVPVDLFGSQGREGYMQGRVHRRLHSKAAQLSDRELLELGKLSFNEQFPALDNMEAWAQTESHKPPLG